MSRNFLVPFSALRRSECPVYTLCGNHDLYYGAEAYLGAIKVLQQPGRYFAIENDHWRIACLDTSLAAARTLRNDGQLDEGQLNWLRKLMALRDGKRLVLMSHHFIISGWDSPAESLRRVLAEDARDKVFAWYWGHEHRAAAYDRQGHGFFGASVGNGAFPENWSLPSRLSRGAGATTPVWFSKSRCTCFGGGSEYCPPGFCGAGSSS